MKANVNSTSREELVNAGVRAELADEILKLRRKGAISLGALDEVPGGGPATLEQLRKVLDFSDRPGNAESRDEQRAETTQERSEEGPVAATATAVRGTAAAAREAGQTDPK